ncbi:hypothetical protein [Shewanella marisflavi]|nr:hypothetical protein [Shewanella marisflavi]
MNHKIKALLIMSSIALTLTGCITTSAEREAERIKVEQNKAEYVAKMENRNKTLIYNHACYYAIEGMKYHSLGEEQGVRDQIQTYDNVKMEYFRWIVNGNSANRVQEQQARALIPNTNSRDIIKWYKESNCLQPKG